MHTRRTRRVKQHSKSCLRYATTSPTWAPACAGKAALGSVLRAWDRLDHDDPTWSAVGELVSESPLAADLHWAVVQHVAACSDADGDGYPDEPRPMSLGTYA